MICARFTAIPCVPCVACDWYQRVGSARDVCDTHERLATLAHNLAIAAGLHRAHRDGIRAGYLRSAL